MTLYNDPTIAIQRTELNTRNIDTDTGLIQADTTIIATKATAIQSDSTICAAKSTLIAADTTIIATKAVEIATNTSGIASINDGRKTVTTAGSAEALASSTTVRYVVVSAEVDNTGVIVVGGTAVVATLATRRGYPLNAGEGIGIPIDNLADVYIDSTVNGDGVTFMCLA